MHYKVFKSLSASQSRARVHTCYQYVYGDSRTSWDERISKFPQKFQIPYIASMTDRILPEILRSSIRVSKPDQDCSDRLYLERRRCLVRQSWFQAFSLRSYPLHVYEIEELALGGICYPRSMAETLADLYWRAHVNANDWNLFSLHQGKVT